jgi:2-succinyl-6-hydroxy-2,4-cyclohexadiene-1-carboxylate synthase
MQVIDCGHGTPVIVIPGIQGRWEWMSPTIESLASDCRVITFSLCDEPSSGFAVDAERGIENYLQQLDTVFERTHLDHAVLVGVSFAGPIAMEYSVRHPERVDALLLVSALPPDWTPDTRARFYMRAPLLLSPVFLLEAPVRAWRELRAALPRFTERLAFGLAQARRLLSYFLSPTRMTTRLRWLGQFEFSDPRSFDKPVMVITGEPGLDRVVPPEMTARYLRALPHARHEVLARTGHLGPVTKPGEFASMVHRFLNEVFCDGRRASA